VTEARNTITCNRGVSMEVQATSRNYVGVSMTVQPKEFVEESIVRRRSEDAILRVGTPVQILREGKLVMTTHAVLAPLQRISSPKTLAIIRAAWFIPGDDIQGGDYVFDINQSVYYVYLAQNEYISEGDVVGIRSIVARCNRVAAIYRNVDKPTGAGGTFQEFQQIEKNIPISIEFIRAGLRMEQPGFYETSTHRAFLPSFYGLQPMDRIKIMDDFLRVDVMDKISFDNTVQATFSVDDRP